MKKYLIILAVVFAAVALQAQLLSEGFEGTTFPPTGWTSNDADADGEDWFLYAIDVHEGLQCAASASWVDPSALTPDNWLITPQVSIPNDGNNYVLEWYSAAQDPAWPQDHYGVYISTTNTDPASFVSVYQETIADDVWDYRSVTLPAATYGGQQIYVAFRHWDCSDWFYMKIDDVQIVQAPAVPVYALSPSTWNYGTVERLNPVVKSFRLQNTGTGTLTVNSIGLDTQTEVNFACDATFPQSLEGGEYYDFNVTFTPLTAGAKTATLRLTEGFVAHTHALSGTCVEEEMMAAFNLTGEMVNGTDALLEWNGLYGNPGYDSWIHWDNNDPANSLGYTEGGTMTVAAKFATTEYGAYAGMNLTKIKFYTEYPTATYTVQVWTGTDADLAPVQEITACQTLATGVVEGWNEVLLTNPYEIQGTEAIYIGLSAVHVAGEYPCGADSGPMVPDRGGLIDHNGTWYNITALSATFNRNWLVRGYIQGAKGQDIELAKKPVYTAPTPVTNEPSSGNPPSLSTLSSGNDRALIGFHVYRDNFVTPITSTPVAAFTYTDVGLLPGTYTYKVHSVHYTGNGPWSNEAEVIIPDTDTLPPTIAHLPVLSTPREDIPYPVYAEVVDDTAWNNPIAGVELWYTIDAGTTWLGPVTMVAGTAPGYSCEIPAQLPGTVVNYQIDAYDSEGNLGQSPVHGFEVNDPVWVWYDAGGTTWSWYGPDQAFSPVVLFENPFYGTTDPVKIYSVDGLAYDVAAATSVTATLHIYSWAGTGGLADFVDVITPMSVTFDHQAYEVFDLTSYNIQITDPYFLIAYDLPVSAAFLFDDTYDYATSYVVMDGLLYNSDPGSWCIGPEIGVGVAGVEAPIISIALVDGYPEISWAEVTGAVSYNVYGSNDPTVAQPWTPIITGTGDLGYQYTGTEPYEFFYVTASTEVDGSKLADTDLAPKITATPQMINATSIKADVSRSPRLPAAPMLRNK